MTYKTTDKEEASDIGVKSEHGYSDDGKMVLQEERTRMEC
jgi:hypothetical protein